MSFLAGYLRVGTGFTCFILGGNTIVGVNNDMYKKENIPMNVLANNTLYKSLIYGYGFPFLGYHLAKYSKNKEQLFKNFVKLNDPKYLFINDHEF